MITFLRTITLFYWRRKEINSPSKWNMLKGLKNIYDWYLILTFPTAIFLKVIKNGQSRETDNIGYTRRRKTKQRKNTICIELWLDLLFDLLWHMTSWWFPIFTYLCSIWSTIVCLFVRLVIEVSVLLRIAVISRSGKEWNTLFLFIMRTPPTK
jgi:hypothetical protein